MVTNDQIEAYLIENGLPFEQVREGLWLIHDDIDYIDNIVVYHTPPVITFRVKLMEAPSAAARMELFTRLLELNATSMVAGAYGLEDDAVVIVDTLQSENLDHNEFQASIDAIAMAVREHFDELTEIINRHASPD
ncbi:MAG: YbjN domain-containing protein [Bradymonadaceae bacterium]|nr:YbjN domain-containing protein [Lujinxingiaceae bacterium]